MADRELEALARKVAAALAEGNHKLTTAESCTGGWVAQTLTAIPGSSAWFDRGFVVYSNEAKQEMLGIPPGIISVHGAVSDQTARAMAGAALAKSRADISLAITGIAGPSGGSPDKPVGTVCFAWCVRGRAPVSVQEHFAGNREAVRHQSVVRALLGVLTLLKPA